MDGEDIEIAAGWKGEAGRFTTELQSLGLLDHPDGYQLHDWMIHQPYATEAPSRKLRGIKGNLASQVSKGILTEEEAAEKLNQRIALLKPANSTATSKDLFATSKQKPCLEHSSPPAPAPAPAPLAITMSRTESSTGRVVQKKSVPIRDRNATTPHTRILKEFDRVHFATHSRDANFAMDIPGENNFALIGKRLKDLLVKGRSEPEILKAIAWFHMKRADWVKGHRFKVFLNNVDRFIDEVAEYEGEKRPMSNPEVDQLHKKLLGRS
jgi:hypothetical protein